MQNHHRASEGNGRYKTVSRIVFFGFVAIAAYFLITEHRAHIVPYLPFVLVALCPLLHMFHGGHRHGGGDESRSDSGAAHRH